MGRTADQAPRTSARDEPIVVSAQGAYRIVVIILAIWTFFAGMALLTGVDALSLGRSGSTAERALGIHMLMLIPVYALLTWRRDEYRLLAWIPYVAQAAIIVPYAWGTLIDGNVTRDGLVLMIVSSVFLGLLIYVRSSSHPLAFFERDDRPYGADEEEAYEEDFAEEDEDLTDEDMEEDEEPAEDEPPRGRPRRYRRN